MKMAPKKCILLQKKRGSALQISSLEEDMYFNNSHVQRGEDNRTGTTQSMINMLGNASSNFLTLKHQAELSNLGWDRLDTIHTNLGADK